ncbi:DNA-binding transcriptional regulator, LysR family [Tessaracoccus bendigoensis DSM 12906]|uniref:DNA-binding transcriptional regulator, LysR family n=1 Tax=Tessaracoccus bendigoensis DSM 12906 TaxID=1123357 RepID=A0A1M6D4E2_9ACTN|nr:LysR family transcriptional regulator [Tessaracoccus bendigoensis]SHI67981.1 DNA-binding transcriptional regulator, LysR family [Tessaracoccus bendigoensis DSM 12906]
MDRAWPDLETLELLVAVADHGGIGAGARAVGMAQPNASRAISVIEAKLGIPLLIRHPRGARLTTQAKPIVARARQVIDAVEQLVAEAATINSDLRTQLEVAASLTIAEHLLPAWLATARRLHTGFEVRVRVCNSEEVFDEVASGRSSLGFVETPQIRRGLQSRPVAVDRLVTVVAPTHPWAGAGAISPGTLASTPLIVRESGSGTRVTLDEALKPLDPICPAVELGSNAAVVAAAKMGDEPAVLSEFAVASAVLHGELVVVPVTGLNLDRQLRAVWRGRRPSPPAAVLLRVALD